MLQVHTEWSDPIDPQTVVDLERHTTYAAFALEVVERSLPSLLTFLNAADAKVLAGTHFFAFSTSPGQWVDVPEIAGRLNFLPWAEPHETMH
ncbi:hypothetical protein VARIO8X_90053 [Burkholderiales bacterium 8X]|nr:hypothetical protein VARIO8X_90053 [Burkholderiales bacterium 8X]